MQPSLSTREADALANMMGADSRRIDGLAHDLGEVKGTVQGIRSDMGHVSKGVDELRGAMTVLSRHAVLMETVVTDISTLRASASELDKRIRASEAETDRRLKLIEVDMPLLRMVRDWTTRGVIGVVVVVAMAVLALVINNKG